MISLFTMAAFAAGHDAGNQGQDFIFDISLAMNQEVLCTVSGAGLTPGAFGSAPGSLTDTFVATGISYGDPGPLPGSDLYGWFDNTGPMWWVGAEGQLICQQTGTLALLDVQVTPTLTDPAFTEAFFANSINNTFDLVTPPPPLLTPTVLFTIDTANFGVAQDFALGMRLTPGVITTPNANFTFTFIPS